MTFQAADIFWVDDATDYEAGGDGPEIAARAVGADFKRVSESQAIRLRREREVQSEPAAFIIGRNCKHPLRTLHILSRTYSRAQFLFVYNPAWPDFVRRELNRIPRLSRFAVAELDDRQQWESLIREAVQLSIHRRRFAGKLANLRRQIVNHPVPVNVEHYRESVQSELYLLSISANSPYGIICLDNSGKVRAWNRGAETIFEVREEDAIGRLFPDLFSGSALGQARKLIFHVQESRIPESGQLDFLNDSTKREVEVNIAPVLDGSAAGDPLIGISVLAVDVSEGNRAKELLRESEVRLREMEKMELVGQLAGGVAHDFNNLLTVICGYTNLGLNEIDASHQVHGYLQEIRKSSDRATALTRELLAYSRRQILRPVKTDLNSVVTQAMPILRHILTERIELVFALGENLREVLVDPLQIRHVIYNLARNAHDAIVGAGKFTIETTNYEPEFRDSPESDTRPRPQVMLVLSDTGRGMDDDTKRHIFEPFFTTKSVGKGIGLGLASVYGIVRQSGGQIQVFSEPGQGTTFRIFLPGV